MRIRLLLRPPTALSMEMPLSLRMTMMLALVMPTLLRASKAWPPVSEPSPMTAMCLRVSLPCMREATAMPRAAEMEVELWPVPKAS